VVDILERYGENGEPVKRTAPPLSFSRLSNRPHSTHWWSWAAAFLFALLGCRSEPPALTLGVAASLRQAMPALIDAYQEESPGPVHSSYAGSGTLRQQAEGGAPLDALFLASPREVEALIRIGAADSRTRVPFASNEVVLVGPVGDRRRGFADLPELPANARVAIGDPAFVPAGAYAREAFRGVGAWGRLTGRLVYTRDVAAALALVRRREVEAAVVYATDCRGRDDVAVWERAGWSGAPRPELVAVVLRDAPARAAAERFLAFVVSPRGTSVLQEFGFGPPGVPGTRRE